MILLALPHLKKHLGIAKQSVAYLANKTIKDAVIFRDKSKYIDINHALFKNYYKTKEKNLKQSYSEFVEACKPDCIILETSGAVEQQTIQKRGTALDKANIITKHQIDQLTNLTLQELLDQHGDSLYNYTAIMEAHKATLELQKLANQVCKQRGELIDAEVLTKTCKGYLDALAGALLTDFVNWSVQEVAALTDCSKQKQILLTDKFKAELSRQLKNTQSRTIKAIEKAQEV
jgi:hypothetical protein